MATPTRIETDLYDAAKAVGTVMSRSAAQQINHWARIGRELEASPSINHRDIARVLAGRSSYDALNGHEQALVRAEWAEGITEARKGLDLATEFEAAGITGWVEADEDGNTVVHQPAPATSGRPTSRNQRASGK
jgi:hypothetical protein